MPLPLAALVLATLFAGAALYISLVEHPARMALDDAAMLAQWQPSYRRALPIQAGLAVLGGVAGLLAWYQSQQLPLLLASLLLLANWPVTLLVILPTNERLMAIPPSDAGPHSRQLLQRWGRLHAIRSLLGSLAALLFLAAVWGRAN